MKPAFLAGLKPAAMLCAGAVWFLAATGPALAEVSRVVVKDSGPMGSFGGRRYTWVTAAMEGTVDRADGTTGRYRVPVSIMYPDRDSNGFGLVDVVNSADYQIYTEERAPLGRRIIYYNGEVAYSDLLRRQGFTYMSVQWARMVTEVLGPEYGVETLRRRRSRRPTAANPSAADSWTRPWNLPSDFTV